MKVAFVRNDSDKSRDAYEQLSKRLENFEFNEVSPEIVIAIGGDGTFLSAISLYKDVNPLFVVINTGTLGFYAEYNYEDLDEFINIINHKDYNHIELQMVNLTADGNSIDALNEIRVESNVSTCVVDVTINGEYLETFRGNGLLVSTSQGSSAYNKSVGGAIVTPTLKSIQLSEIAGINNTKYASLGSSLVLSPADVIELNVQSCNTVIGYDNAVVTKPFNHLKITGSDKNIKLIRSKNIRLISRLRKAFISED